ncbi:serine/threonine protein kinase [Coleofasciculus sp. F4-SAH-05]|uniref:serine/threonine protein kinase n=1 Tax=Coleofasciculus sp. F4-SAH-05 TaxID=3069525 RepID=UPI0032F137D1
MRNKVLNGRYAIQEQLSKNAGRRTLLAQDLQTQEFVVIKLLMFAESFQWDDLKLFEREAQTLQRLSHPAIPRYLDYFDLDTSTGKGFVLVQSYIPAKSLEQWLKSGRTFSEEDIKQLAQALLEILHYLHEQQPPVIHRDIKPSNILLTNRSGNSIGQVYLVDFGSVQTLAAKQGSTITVVGTYGYMPPEQFGGRTVPASDLYSLGTTLIYLVTGRHPSEFPQENLRIQFESSVNISSDLIDWLKWMTQPSLNRRLASAGEAMKALEQPRQRTYIPAILAVKQKPLGSKIKVKKEGGIVDILIPPQSIFNGELWISAVFNSLWGIMFLYPLLYAMHPFIVLNTPLVVNFAFVVWMILTLPFTIKGMSFLIEAWGFIIRSTRLHFKSQEIILTYEWLGLKFYKSPIMKNTISQLRYTNRYQTITIIDPQQEYVLSAYSEGLVEPEMEWLAHELSEWSGVPITIEDEGQEVERMAKTVDS